MTDQQSVRPAATTDAGIPVASQEHSLTVGPDGPPTDVYRTESDRSHAEARTFGRYARVADERSLIAEGHVIRLAVTAIRSDVHDPPTTEHGEATWLP
jgi:hypothetical protein